MELLAGRGCTCVLLMLAVLSCGSGMEDPVVQGLTEDALDSDDSDDMGETNEGVELINGPVESQGSVSSEDAEAVVLGSKALGTYSHIQSGLMTRADEIRAIYDHPPVPAKGVTYSQIPGMVMRRKGMINHDKSRPECESTCNSYKSCLSYSYNHMARECIWAMDSFQYSVADEFFLKKRGADGKLTLQYETIPALMVHTSEGVSGGTKEECLYECSKDTDCSGFSFTTPTQNCITTTKEFIEFDARWDYYEKDQDTHKISGEIPPSVELAEAKEKKQAFGKHTSQQIVIRNEQSAKSQQNRVGLRLRAVASEVAFKVVQDNFLLVEQKFEKARMEKESALAKQKSDQKLYLSLQNADAPLAKKLSDAKLTAGGANSKEAKEKADIDVRYFEKKLMKSSAQTKAMKISIGLTKPKELRAKKNYIEVNKEKMKIDVDKAEAMGQVDFRQANVDTGDKEKNVKTGINNIMSLNFRLEAASLEQPFSQEKVDNLQELTMKAKSKLGSTKAILERSKQVLKLIVKKNSVKIELDAKQIKQVVERKKEKFIKEREFKKDLAEKKKSEEINAKKHKEATMKGIKEVQRKDDLAQKEKAEADKLAKIEQKKLASEEAKKTAHRVKFGKELGLKKAENQMFVEKERKEKADAAAVAEKEVQKKFLELKAFKNALALSTKQEQKAKEEQEKAKEKKVKSVAVASELAKKSSVMAQGYVKTKEIADKKTRKAAADSLAAAIISVRIKKIAMANAKCNTDCKSSGLLREKGDPNLVGCYKDQKETPAMSALTISFGSNSLDFCNANCQKDPKNTLFGVQEDYCFCGSGTSYKKYGEAENSACVLTCSGRNDQLCGGPLVNRMYTLSVPPNVYEWSGYTVNASRPSMRAHYNFMENSCHCVGARMQPI